MERVKVLFGVYKYETLLIIIILVFVCSKIPYLSLPHFWDESWSYVTAIHKMYESGPILLPGTVDVDATRGHPLFFYGAASMWMTLFGTSLVVKHTFALLISVILLVSVYFISKRLFNARVGLIACTLLCLQIHFFIQSTLLLPEVLVALLSLCSIYCVVLKRYLGLSLSLSLLLLTKESGFVLGVVMAVYFLIQLFVHKNKREAFRLFAALGFPVIVIGAFFLYQHQIYGWYLYPFHMELVDYDLIRVKDIMLIGINEMFITNNKYLVIVISIILLTIYYFKKGVFPSIKWYAYQRDFVALSLSFSIAYLIFCGVNFYTYRYLMPVLVLGVILLSALLDYAMNIFIDKRWQLLVPGILLIVFAFNFDQKRNSSDVNLGMMDAIQVKLDAIGYFESHVDTSNTISMHSYQQRIDLQDISCGYLKNGKAFEHIQWDINAETDYAYFDNIEPDSRHHYVKTNDSFDLVYQSTRGHARVKIYKRNIYE